MRQFMICKGFEQNDIKLPERSTKFSAGYDFKSLEDFDIGPNQVHIFKTGVKAKMDEDDVLLIFIRSSLAIKKGLQLANNVAVIDADYFSNPDNDGHIMIALKNTSNEIVSIKKGDKIAQGMFTKYEITIDDKSSNERTGGTGSTGR